MADDQPPPPAPPPPIVVVVEATGDDVATDLLPPVAPAGGPAQPLGRAASLPRGLRGRSVRSATPQRPRSPTPLMLHQERTNSPVTWRSITPFLDREPRERTPFELGPNILLQLASYHAIFDMAAVIDISEPTQRPAILSEHSVLDQAAIMDISHVEYVYIEDDDLVDEEGVRVAAPPPPPPPKPAAPVWTGPPPVPSKDAFVGATPQFVVPKPKPPPPPPPPIVIPLVVEPEMPELIDEIPPPPPTPMILTPEPEPLPPPPPAVPEEPVVKKKKMKMVLMTKRQLQQKRQMKERLRKQKLAAEEKARKEEEARLAEEKRIADEEEERRLQEEEEEEERLRLEQEAEEAEALALAEAMAAEAARLALLPEPEPEPVVIDPNRDSSPETFAVPARDLGKWQKLSAQQQQKGVVRGRSDPAVPEQLTEHQRDMEWQRLREQKRLPRISVHLKDVSAQQYENVKLSCAASGPNLVIKWYRDGEQIERDTKFKMTVSEGLISLEIVRAVPNDTGRYRCRLVNDNGEAVSSANVTVKPKLKAKPVPPIVTVVRDHYHLHDDILVIEATILGTPRPKVVWVRNCVELTNTFKYAPLEQAHNVYKLEIYRPTHKDAGQYSIRAKNKVDTIEVQYQVVFAGKPLNTHLPLVHVAHAGALKEREEAIIQAAEDDLYAKEQYELIKAGGFVSPYRKPHKPHLQPPRLRFANVLRDRAALAGSKVRLACLVHGSDPNIQWLKDDKPIEYGRHVRSITGEGVTTLDIDKVAMHMTGEYKCVAWTENCEPIQTACYVRVFESRTHGADKAEPIFLLSIRDAHHTKENDLVIDCKLGGNPLPSAQWFKDDAPVELNDRIQQIEQSDGQTALCINRPTTADSGVYKCVATSKLGACEQTHEVIFTPPIVPVTGRRQRAAKAEAAPPQGDADGTEAMGDEKPREDRLPEPHVIVPVRDEKGAARGTKTDPNDERPAGAFKTGMNIEESGYVRRHVLPSMKEILKAGRSKLSFATSLTNRVVPEGGKAKLSCAVLGPEAMARWTKDDVAIKYGGRYKNASGDGIIGLEVLNCKPSDSGLYELTVKNLVSCLTSVCKLEVYEVKKKATGDLRPTFTRNLNDVYHVDSNQIHLQTHVRAVPPATIEWTYNCMPIDKDMLKYKQRTFADGTCELIVNYPHPIDSGKYRCLASNRLGDSSVVHTVVFDGRDECIARNRVKMYLADKKRLAQARIDIRGGLPEARAHDAEDDDGLREQSLQHQEQEEYHAKVEEAAAEAAEAAEAAAAAEAGDKADADAAEAEDAEDGEVDAEADAEAAATTADGGAQPTTYSRAKPAARKNANAASHIRGGGSIRFVTHLVDRCVPVGTKTKLTGYLEGGDVQIRWFKDDKKLPSTPKCRLTNTNGVVTLELRAAKETDAATYKCVAKNEFGEVSSSAQIQVFVPVKHTDECAPMFIKTLRDTYNSKISELTLTCSVRAKPEPYIFWAKDNMPIQENAKYKIKQLEDGTCELLVSFVDWKDLGKYVCKAENKLGKAQLTHVVDVKLREPNTTKLHDFPAALPASAVVTFKEVDDEVATAAYEAGEGARGVWTIDDIEPWQPEPEPLYERRRNVRERRLLPKDYLHFETFLKNLTAVIGTRVQFTCYIVGPEPRCTWYKELPQKYREPELLELHCRKRFKTEMHNGLASLIIKRVSEEDAGKYRVVARNAVGEVTCAASLFAYHKLSANTRPYFINSIKDHYNMQDDEMTFECRVRGDPEPRIVWKLDDKTITPETNPRSKQRHLGDGYLRLVIQQPGEADNGVYSCHGTNVAGTDHTEHRIQFEGREAHVKLNSLGFAHRTTAKPHILHHINDHTVSKGGMIGLVAELEHEADEIQWWHNGRKLLPWSSKVTALQEYCTYMLIVPKVQPEDAGEYMMRAINEHGRAESVGHVYVVGPFLDFPNRSPQMLQRPPTEQLIATGDPFEFAVTMTGMPKPKLSLYKGLRDLTRSERATREQNEDHFRISIENVDPSDSGTYWMVARNEHGTDRAFVTITVKACKRRHKKHHKKHHEQQ